jgi:hypothetical protein
MIVLAQPCPCGRVQIEIPPVDAGQNGTEGRFPVEGSLLRKNLQFGVGKPLRFVMMRIDQIP